MKAQEVWWINLLWMGTLCHRYQIHNCAQDVFCYENLLSAGKGKQREGGFEQGRAPTPIRKLKSLQISSASLHRKGSWGDFLKKSTARVSSPQQYFLMMTEPLFPFPPCYQLANLPAHSDTQLREMKTVLLIDETLDKITWF